MKRLCVLFLIFPLLLSGCGLRTVSQAVGEVLATAPELERVETSTFSVSRIITEYADGSSEKQVYDYDYGNAYTACTYYENDEKIGTETYTTDEHGNILTATPDWEGGENRSFSYIYDESGKQLTKEAFIDGQPDCTTEYTYSEEGTLTRKIVTPAKGLRSEYLYDAQGRETERLDYDGDVLVTRTVTQYADHGKRSSVTVYDADGNVTYWEDYAYNQKSSKETVLEYSAEGELLRKLINTYDTHDLLMMQEVYTADDMLISTTYWYNLEHKFIDYVEVTEPTE